MIVTITGQDGSGKTTLLEQLVAAFESPRVTSMRLPVSTFVNTSLTISGAGTPMGDKHTDRLIFALDNRMAHYKFQELLQKHDVIFCQRGWMDSFIHGAVQGYNYEQTAELTRVADLVPSHCSIYLNCEPTVAYERIANDPLADKFETPEYMKEQYHETKQFYDALDTHEVLQSIFREPRLYIDTTKLTPEETFSQAHAFITASLAKGQ